MQMSQSGDSASQTQMNGAQCQLQCAEAASMQLSVGRCSAKVFRLFKVFILSLQPTDSTSEKPSLKIIWCREGLELSVVMIALFLTADN